MYLQTVRMCSHTGSGYIRGYREVRKPQIFDVSFTECRLDRFIKVSSREHRRHGVG